jgi:hypothetical protein
MWLHDDEAGGTYIRDLSDIDPLYDRLRADQEEVFRRSIRRVDECPYALILREGEHLDDWLTLRSTLSLRDLVGTQTEDSTRIGKCHEGIVVATREEDIDLVFFSHGHGDSFPTSALHTEGGGLHTLEITIFREGNHDIFIRDGIRRIPFTDGPGDYLSTTVITEFISDLRELSRDDIDDPLMMHEDISEIGDESELLSEFVLYLLAFESCESLELHLQDRSRLLL